MPARPLQLFAVVAALAALSALLLPPTALAQSGNTVLGRNGQTYELLSRNPRTLSEPNGSDSDHLTLAVTDSVGARSHLVVPGTEGPEAERSPRLVYFDATDTVFLLWDSQTGGIHSQLNLVAYSSAEGWSEPVVLAGNPFSIKLEPQFAVTRDQVDHPDEEGLRLERTVVHLVWREEGSRVYYSPVLLFEDSFELVAHRLFRLDSLFGEDETGLSEVAALVEVQPGSDGRSVTVGFTRPGSLQLESIQVRLLPGGLSDLAEAAYDTLLDSSLDSSLENAEPDLGAAAASARAHIIFIGRNLNRQMVGLVAAEAESYITGAGDELGRAGLVAVADGARAHIIFIGAKIDREGLGSPAVSGLDGDTRFARIVTTDMYGNERAHYLELRRTSSRPLPADVTQPTRALFSPDGSEAILAWTERDRVIYRESLDDGSWSEGHVLSYGDERTHADVYRLLEQRIQARR